MNEPSNPFVQSDEELVPTLGQANPIRRLYSQIRHMSELAARRAQVIDSVRLSKLQDLKSTVSVIIDQFQEQKKVILHRFDHWIQPIAQDILTELLSDVQTMKENLAEKLNHLEETSAEEWEEEAKEWAQMYAKWNDSKGLTIRILEAAAEKAADLIGKDIQMIQDYQTQSLSNLPQETEVFRSLEERLAHAIEEPLKQLLGLRTQAKEYSSIQQASDWIANLQERRETYFDQLLMKIDHVMKDVVDLEEVNDWTAYVEIEGEIVFMASEFKQILEDAALSANFDECEKEFLMARLEALLDHAADLAKHRLPLPMHERIQAVRSNVEALIQQLQCNR